MSDAWWIRLGLRDPDDVQHYDRETGALTVHTYGLPCDYIDPELGPCPTWPRWTETLR